MRYLLAAMVAWAGLGWSVAAQTYPRLYDVTGVAGDDVLNVRAAPTASGEIIGHLTPYQRDIEVLAVDPSQKWGLVNSGERAGWVFMHYLRQAAENRDYALAQGLRCSGTEPFWSLNVVQGQSAVFSTMTGVRQSFPAGLVTQGAGRPDRYLLGLGDGSVAIIAREQCDDAMSDREFALRIDYVADAGGQQVLLSGCCSIAPR